VDAAACTQNGGGVGKMTGGGGVRRRIN